METFLTATTILMLGLAFLAGAVVHHQNGTIAKLRLLLLQQETKESLSPPESPTTAT